MPKRLKGQREDKRPRLELARERAGDETYYRLLQAEVRLPNNFHLGPNDKSPNDEVWVDAAWNRLRNRLAHSDEGYPSELAEVAHAIPEEASPEQGVLEPYLFRMMALVLPRRLWEEELGDALEVLHALRKSDAPSWQIRLKIFSTFAWGLVNALREIMSAATGQAREREK